MPKRIELVGFKFGKLTVISLSDHKDKTGRAIYWDCICDCGNKSTARSQHLRGGNIKSCGCMHRDKEVRRKNSEWHKGRVPWNKGKTGLQGADNGSAKLTWDQAEQVRKLWPIHHAKHLAEIIGVSIFIIRGIVLGKTYRAKRSTSTNIKEQTVCERCRKGITNEWAWERTVERAKQLMEKLGYFPTTSWCQRNGYGSLVHDVIDRHHKKWKDLALEVDLNYCARGTGKWQTLDGKLWDSLAEGYLAQFLYKRNIEYKKGMIYPKSFCDQYGITKAKYDLHFRGINDHYRDRWVSVEVEGGYKQEGERKSNYAQTMQIKKEFHHNNTYFLVINYKDCYDEKKLSNILRPYIGDSEPVKSETIYELEPIFINRPVDIRQLVKSVQHKFPGGILPGAKWFQKNGFGAGVVAQIAEFGFRKLREEFGHQVHNKKEWSLKKIYSEYATFFKDKGVTPGAVVKNYQKNKGVLYSKEDYKRARDIQDALHYYGGSASEAQSLIGIRPSGQLKRQISASAIVGMFPGAARKRLSKKIINQK